LNNILDLTFSQVDEGKVKRQAAQGAYQITGPLTRPRHFLPGYGYFCWYMWLGEVGFVSVPFGSRAQLGSIFYLSIKFINSINMI
jgi:hypothetical protein